MAQDSSDKTANNYTSTAPANPNKEYDKPERPEDSPLGVYAPFDYSSEP